MKGGEPVKCAKLIRGGFSFCGTDIAELGLSYTPENENTYVYRPTEVNVNSEAFDGHDGGYFYGVSKQPKEFILRCYFEDEAIDHGVMERIYHLFRLGKSGKLIFSRKPWQYYYATVTSSPHPELSNYMNGLITITMQAYYPFARGDDLYYDTLENTDERVAQKIKNDLVMESTALLETEDMVPPMSFTNITSAKTMILHNPGTEYAPLSITLSGNVGQGVIIKNNTTNQQCKIVAVDKAHTTNVNKVVHIDGINGCTYVMGANEKKPGFMYHDSGFIQLAPAYPAIRNIFLEDSISDIITTINVLCEDVKGQYIYIEDCGWVKIKNSFSDGTERTSLLLEKAVDTSSTNRTMITKMNEIEILPIDTIELTQLNFSYKPTYA